MTTVHTPPFNDSLAELWKSAAADIVVASPWLKRPIIEPLLAVAPPSRIRWSVLTRGLLSDFASGASDLEAFELLIREGAQVYLHGRVHAKAFVADESRCMVGSGNLTIGGTQLNLEIAVETAIAEVASSVRGHVQRWMAASRAVDQAWAREMRRVLDGLPADGARRSAVRAPELEGPSEPIPGPDLAVAFVELLADTMPESKDEPLEAGFRYADLPLPSEWRAYLPVPMPIPALPLGHPEPFARWFHLACARASDRGAQILVGRLEHELTLRDLGERFGVTRERIRQLERVALDNAGMEPLGPMLDSAFARPILAFPRNDRSASDRAAVLCAARSSGRSWEAQLTEEYLLAYDRVWLKTVRERLVHLFEEPRYRSASEVAEVAGLELDELGLLAAAEERLICAGDRIGWRSWSNRDLLVALARVLADAGFVEWHFNEMAKALRLVCPSRFAKYESHDVGAITTRPSEIAFEHTGRKGRWRLAERGDGYRNTFAALGSILSRYPCPLHVEDLHQLVAKGRDVSVATIQAALRTRDDVFEAHGNGIFGLKQVAYAADNEITTWLERQIGSLDTMSIDDLRARALTSGIPPEAVRGAASVSAALAYRHAVADKVPSAIVRRGRAVAPKVHRPRERMCA